MFKKVFKYYKSKDPPPELSSVLDFSRPFCQLNHEVVQRLPYALSENEVVEFCDYGLVPCHQWKIYELKSNPGFIYIVNPFTSFGQRLWIQRSLSEYTKPPNKLNLHAHGDIKADEDWWSICNSDLERKKVLYRKLRWVTFGYHHNWDTKVYSEHEKSEFPAELKELSRIIVKLSCSYDFNPQAAIINYYNVGSTLSGHTDHSEPNRDAPLISFSFGQEAIFLIGGLTVDDNCKAVLVKSGDIMIMSGNSRLSYHGVPLIRQTDIKPWYSNEDDYSQMFWTPYEDYILSSRINLNVRQVLNPGLNELLS